MTFMMWDCVCALQPRFAARREDSNGGEDIGAGRRAGRRTEQFRTAQWSDSPTHSTGLLPLQIFKTYFLYQNISVITRWITAQLLHWHRCLILL